jgi:hypothetical protein
MKQNYSSLIKKTYLFLKSDTYQVYTYRNNDWASLIKTLLSDIGLLYKFKIIDMLFNMIKHIYSSWYSDINNSNRLKILVYFQTYIRVRKLFEYHN